MKKSLIKWLCLSGILSTIFYLLHDVVGAMNYPGYDWMSSAVSDLTAVDSKSYITASSFVTLHKIFNCICCISICTLIKNEKKSLKIGIYLFTIMHFISTIGYTLFPLTSAGYDGSIQSFMHVYVITITVVLLSIISLITIAIGSFKCKYKVLGTLAIIFLLLMFIGAVGSQNCPKSIFVIFERFSTYSAVLFTCILGIYVFKKDEDIKIIK